MNAIDLPAAQAARVELLAKMSVIGKQPAAAGFAQAPEPEKSAIDRDALGAGDALSECAETALADLIQWAKKSSAAIQRKMAACEAVGAPVDAIHFRMMQQQLGWIIADSEQKYQRSWHANALGLGSARRAA